MMREMPLSLEFVISLIRDRMCLGLGFAAIAEESTWWLALAPACGEGISWFAVFVLI